MVQLLGREGMAEVQLLGREGMAERTPQGSDMALDWPQGSDTVQLLGREGMAEVQLLGREGMAERTPQGSDMALDWPQGSDMAPDWPHAPRGGWHQEQLRGSVAARRRVRARGWLQVGVRE